MGRLTEANIEQIRSMHARGIAKKEIARQLGVVPKVVRYWLNPATRARHTEWSKLRRMRLSPEGVAAEKERLRLKTAAATEARHQAKWDAGEALTPAGCPPGYDLVSWAAARKHKTGGRSDLSMEWLYQKIHAGAKPRAFRSNWRVIH